MGMIIFSAAIQAIPREQLVAAQVDGAGTWALVRRVVLPQLRWPALFVAGARSGYVRPAHREAIRRLFPHARLVTLRDAGHWLHAEQPEAFLRTVQPFLAVSTARMSSR